MESVIAILSFFAVFGAVVSLCLSYGDRRRSRRDALVRRLRPTEEPSEARTVFQGSLAAWLEHTAGRLFDLDPLRELLIQSGSQSSPGAFLLMSSASGLGAGCITLVTLGSVLLFGLAAFTFGMAPLLLVLLKRHRHERALLTQLPDAISMIARGLRAGQSLDEALRQAGKASPRPLGAELRRIQQEMSVGLPFETAIRNFRRRFRRLPDVRILCAAFLIQRETGGNLTGLLDGIALTIRERFRVRRQIRAITAEGRLSATILGLLPFAFALFMWLLRPDYLEILYRHSAGRIVLGAALLLEGTGFAIMYILTRVEA